MLCEKLEGQLARESEQHCEERACQRESHSGRRASGGAGAPDGFWPAPSLLWMFLRKRVPTASAAGDLTCVSHRNLPA